MNTKHLFHTVALIGALVFSAPAWAQPSFSKAFMPDTIGPGSVTTLQFTITNGAATPVTDLAFTDVLPAGVTIAVPANAGSTCTGGTLTAPDGGGTVSLTGGSVAGFDNCTVTVDVTSSTIGTHTNLSGDLTSSAGNSGTATDDLNVTASRPGFSKSFSPASVGLGGRSTLTFTIDNSDNASGVFFLNFTDNLPSGMVVADPANASTDCAATTLTATAGSNVVSLASLGGLASLAAGATCTVTVDVTGTAIGTQTNVSGELTTTTGGPSVSSGKASDTLEVTGSTLSLVKAFTDDPVNPGGTVTLEFTVTNFDRNFAAANIAFTDDLTATLTGLTATGLPASDVCGTGSMLTGTTLLSLSGGSLAPQASCTFSVTLQVPAGASAGTYPNTTSSITGDLGGSAEVGDPATETLFVNDAPLLTKTFLADTVGAGGTTTLEFTITNTSSTSEASSFAFMDNLAAFISGTAVTSLPAAGFCGAGSFLTPVFISGDLNLSMSGGTLPAGGSCTFSVDLLIPAGATAGTFTNTTSAISAMVDGISQSGKPASDTLTVAGGPTISKSFTDDPVAPGDTVTLEFTITHDMGAAADATDIAFTDDLAAALAGLAATGLPANDVCGPGSQLSGTSSLTFTGGTLAPGASCTFSATLQVPAAALPGTYTNTTSSLMANVSGVATISNAAQNELAVTGLTFSKSFTDDPILPGETVTLEFTIENTGTVDATGMFFTDSLTSALPGLAAVGLPATDICGAGSQLSGTSSLTFTGGTLAAGTSCTFSATLSVPGIAADGTYSNITSGLVATVGGSVVVLNPATDNLVIDSDLLVLTKSFTDDPVAPGGTVTLEFTISNLSTTTSVSDIWFTDDLDAALTGLAATGLPAMDICGPGSQLSGTSLLSFSAGSLAPGASCTFSATLMVPAAVPLSTVANNVTSNIIGLGGPEIAITGGPGSDQLLINFLDFSKAFDGPSTATGTAVLSFTIENLSTTSTVTDIGFTDDLDAVISGLVATGLPAADVCGTGSQISGTSLLTLSGGNLLPGGSCTIPVTVQIPATAQPGTFPNTTSDLFQAGLMAAGPATADLVIEPPPTFAKAFAPASIGVNQTSTLTFTIDNSASAITAGSLDFSDPLPAGMVVATPANASTTCSGGTVTAVAGSGTISYTGGSVSAGASCTVSVDVTATSSGMLANVTGDLTSSSGNSGTASDTLTANPQPDFSKAFAPNPIAIAGTSTLTFTIENFDGTVAATSLSFSDTLPAGMTVATPANASTTCTGGTITAVAGSGTISYAGGSVAALASCTVSVDTTASPSGNFTNVSGDLTSSLGNSGTASDTLEVSPPPIFGKAFAPTPVVQGEVSTLTFTIDNGGGSLDATGLDFSDTLPAGMIVATPANASTTCSGGTITAASGAGTVSYAGGSVATGASCTISVDIRALASGTLTNVSGDLTSSLGNSGNASADLIVNPAPVPTFAKAFALNPVAISSVSTLTFTIDNSTAAVDAGSLDFTDSLPAGMTVATPANASTTCTGGTITAVAGSGTISYTGGSVATGASCTISVDTTASPSGNFANISGSLTSDLGDSGTATDTLVVEPPPTFGKVFAPTSIAVGATSTLTFTIDNGANTLDAAMLAFSDSLPAGMELAATPNASTTCTGGTLTAAGGSGSVDYAGGTVSGGASCTVSVDVIGTLQGDLVNTSGDLTSSLGNSGTAEATLTVVAGPSPSFSKSFGPAIVAPGDTVLLEFTITNEDLLNPLAGTSFTDDLTAVLPGLVATDTPKTGLCGGKGTLDGTDLLVWTQDAGADFAPGETCTFDATLMVPLDAPPGMYTNTTSDLTFTGAGEGGPEPAASAASAGGLEAADGGLQIRLMAQAPPAQAQMQVLGVPFVEKAFLEDPVTSGGVANLRFTVTNPDPFFGATDIAFSDDLDAMIAGLVAVDTPMSDICGAGSQISGTSILSFTGGNLGPAESCSFTVMLQLPNLAPATFTNFTSTVTSTVNGQALESDPANLASATLAVIARPDPLPVPALGNRAIPVLITGLLLMALVTLRRRHPVR